MDNNQLAPRRRARADGPGRQSVVQPDPQRRRHQRPVQRHRSGRRRGELPAAAGRNPATARLSPGPSRRRRPHAATRHPALRPHQASSLPQRPGHDRRRLLRPHDLHGPRAGHPPARQATRRPAGPLPLPRPAQPLTAESGRRRRAPLVTAPADVIGIILDAATTTWPGPADEIQLDLFLDYASNIELYPKFQDYFRTRQPPLLAIWGRNDPFFLPAGAEAFKRDIPAADVRLLDTGHFALETHADEIATAIRTFLTDQQL